VTDTLRISGDHGTVTAELRTIAPEEARELLTRSNTHNRNLRRRVVTDYARDMRAGTWIFNGESIKLDHDGTLLDGQHRLAAIIEAGIPVSLLVITGFDTVAQDTMDTGRPRTSADVLSLHGETHATLLAATLRRVWMWDNGHHRLHSNYKPTNAECAALLSERGEIRRSVEIAAGIYKTFPQIPLSVTATAHHILSRVDTAVAVWFFARVGDGANLPVGHPVLTLRTRILNDRMDGKRLPEYRVLAYLIRSWNAVREGQELTRLQFGPASTMPMPK